VYSSFKLIHYSIAFKNGKKKAGSCDFYIIIKLNNPKKKKKKRRRRRRGQISNKFDAYAENSGYENSKSLSLSLSLSIKKKTDDRGKYILL